MIRYVMGIDIETQSTENNAKIISIGATIIDVYTLKCVDWFEGLIDPNCELQINRDVSDGTMRWWDTRDLTNPVYPTDIAKQMSFAGTEDTVTVLNRFSEFLTKTYTLNTVGNIVYNMRGPEFDYCLLDCLYKELDLKLPIRFSLLDSNRTTERFSKILNIPATTQKEFGHILPYEGHYKHTALFDSGQEAIDAAKAYQAAYWYVELGKQRAIDIIDGWANLDYIAIPEDE